MFSARQTVEVFDYRSIRDVQVLAAHSCFFSSICNARLRLDTRNDERFDIDGLANASLAAELIQRQTVVAIPLVQTPARNATQYV